METQKKYDIFISYRKSDNLRQAQLIRTLLAMEYPNLDVSLDSHNLHGKWFPNLVERIDTCKKFVVLISENSLHYPFHDTIQESMYIELAQCSSDDIVAKVKELNKNNVSIDYFRLEIARMLSKKDVTIVPVLLAKGTELFTLDSLNLPQDLADLKDHQSVSFIDNKINTEEFDTIIPSIKRLLFPDVSDSTSTNAEDTQVNNDQSDDFELKKTLAQLDDRIVYDGFVFGKDYENMGVSLLGASRYSDAKTINIPGSIIVDDKEFSVTSIGENAFICFPLVVVDIPDTVRTIGMGAFSGCEKLRFVKMSKSTITIGEAAFFDCSSLKEITIPETVNTIQQRAFASCSSLQSIIISEEVEEIGREAFCGCKSLSSINIKGNKTRIGINAFYGCNNIQSLTIPKRLKKRCFPEVEFCSITYIDRVEGDVEYPELDSKGILVEIKDAVVSEFKSENEKKEEWKKEEIKLFACMVAIEAVIALIICCVVCYTMISKGNAFFADRDYEMAVTKYSSAVKIPTLSIIDKREAFYNLAICNEIGFGTIKDYNKSFEYYRKAARRGKVEAKEKIARCYETGELGVEKDINKSIKKYVEISEEHLQYINVGKNKVSIFGGDYTSEAKKIILSSRHNKSKVVSIEDRAFEGSNNLVEIVIPNSVTSIGVESFSNCLSLKSIVIEDGNPVYDSRENCNAIIETKTNTILFGCMSTTIPESIMTIGSEAFSGCDSLAVISIPESVKSIGDGAFLNCTSLETITIPGNVLTIGVGAFEKCYHLDSVVISEGVERIGDGAFIECFSLSSITIPRSVKYVGDWVFDSCTSLVSIYYNGTQQQWDSITKGNGWDYQVVHCTDGDVEGKYYSETENS
jgi:hypothetical protein